MEPGSSGRARGEVRLRRRRRFAGRQSSHKKKYNGNANEPQNGQRNDVETEEQGERRREGGGWRTKLSREETSANWVRWDRLSSCRVEVPASSIVAAGPFLFFFFVCYSYTSCLPSPLPPL